MKIISSQQILKSKPWDCFISFVYYFLTSKYLGCLNPQIFAENKSFKFRPGQLKSGQNVVQLEVHLEPEMSDESDPLEERQQCRADLSLQKKDSGMVQKTWVSSFNYYWQSVFCETERPHSKVINSYCMFQLLSFPH